MQNQERFDGSVWGGGDDHERDSASQEDDFRIMTEIRNDEVVESLQVIIDQFSDHIEPHAVIFVTQLSDAYQNYYRAGEEKNNAAMAVAQCLD